MDLGNEIGTTFTGHPVPQMINVHHYPEYLKKLLSINQTKLLIAKRVCEEMNENRMCMFRMQILAMRKVRIVSLYCLKMRIANSNVFLHLMNRYRLLLWWEMLNLMLRLRMVLPNQLHVALRQNQEQILSHPPNVHDHFLWGDNYRDGDVQGVEDSLIFQLRRYRLNDRVAQFIYIEISPQRRNLYRIGGLGMLVAPRWPITVPPDAANRGGPSEIVAEEIEVTRTNSDQQADRPIESVQLDGSEEPGNDSNQPAATSGAHESGWIRRL